MEPLRRPIFCEALAECDVLLRRYPGGLGYDVVWGGLIDSLFFCFSTFFIAIYSFISSLAVVSLSSFFFLSCSLDLMCWVVIRRILMVLSLYADARGGKAKIGSDGTSGVGSWRHAHSHCASGEKPTVQIKQMEENTCFQTSTSNCGKSRRHGAFRWLCTGIHSGLFANFVWLLGSV